MLGSIRSWALVVALPTVLGCASNTTRARMLRFESRAQADDERIAALSVRVEEFERSVDDVLGLYRRATADFRAAEVLLEKVDVTSQVTAQAHARAVREYEIAARNWRLVTIAILTAATWDYAGHLCGTRMTTAQYRRELRGRGIDLDGLDADHGLPKSKGGADHPLNYRMIDSSLNRSLGNDVFRKLMVHPTHLLQGAAVSALLKLRCSAHL